ncbi:hypothetical protein [Roseibacillus ishigakijimensis]|nr:hypothetical protein [Roseibacillus ishigakijimensis]
MLMWVNCGMLWWFTWIQFVLWIVTHSSSGLDVVFWIEKTPLFGLNFREVFILVAIPLSLFCLLAVYFGTRSQKGLLKRMFVTLLFALICTGFSVGRDQMKWQQRARLDTHLVEPEETRAWFILRHDPRDSGFDWESEIGYWEEQIERAETLGEAFDAKFGKQ